MTKTAFITGIAGQDGSYLAELLLEKGYDVYGLVRRLSTPNTGYIKHITSDIHLIEGDLDNAKYWYRRAHRALPHENTAVAEIAALKATLTDGTH